MEFADAVLYGTIFISLYFEVLLLIAFFENSPEVAGERPYAQTDTLPTVAVIVPCWNEETTIAGTLDSLLALDYPKEKLEIIAVNDGSTDTTLSVLRTYEMHGITVIDKPNGGKHSAMNAALARSQAEIIGCLDADSFVEPDALRILIKHFNDERVAAVTPSIKVSNAHSGILQVIQKAEYGLAVFLRNAFARLDSLFITPGPFSFFRRSAIEEVGPWRHAHSTEDLEMCMRLQLHHKKVTNEPRAIVHTKAPATLRQLLKQRVRWTYGFIKNAIDYYHMFLNPRYGTLGMVILPMSIISIFSALFLFSTMIWNTLLLVANEFVRFQTVGITAPTAPRFDLFYVSTDVLLTVTAALAVITLVLIAIGKRISKDTMLSYDMPVYLALYGFLTPVWLATAVYKAVVAKDVRWR